MGISFWAVQSILTGILSMSKVSVRWVQRMLTYDQKKDSARYFLSRLEDDPGDFIERVLTQDETWVNHFDPESKMQIRKELGLIFLCTLHLLPRYEDDPVSCNSRFIYGLPTLTQIQSCRANNGSTQVHPLLKKLKGFIQQGR